MNKNAKVYITLKRMTSILEIIFAINLPKYVKYFEFGSLKTKTNSQFIGYLLIKIH